MQRYREKPVRGVARVIACLLGVGTAIVADVNSRAVAGDKDSRSSRQSSDRRSDTPTRSSETDRSNSSSERSGENSSSSSTPGGSTTSTSSNTSESGQKTSDDGSRKSVGKSETAKKDQRTEEGPPDTVAEWFQRLVKPSQPSNEKATDVKATDVKPADVKPGFAPAGQAATAPSTPSAKLSTPKAIKPAGRDAVPTFAIDRPEILAPNLSPKSLERAVSLGFIPNGSTVLPQLSLGFTRLQAPSGMTARQAQDLLKQALPDQGAEINQTYRIYKTATVGQLPPDQAPPATPMNTPCGTDRCFGSSVIKWQSQLQSCAKSVKIGVIDTAIDRMHPTFKLRRIEPRVNVALAGQEAGKRAENWHGTGVLALLAGEPQSGTPGLIPDAKYYTADVFFADADGAPWSNTASLLEALDWLDKKGVGIINMSLSGPHDELLKGAIGTLARKGVIFVAAVGNDGPTAPPSYPSAYEQVIAVTAVNKDLSNYRHANRGDHVDLAAPGVGIWTAMPGAPGAYHSGTSFAVPYATAVIAAIYPSLVVKSKAAALQQLTYQDLGPPGRDPIYGRGLVIAPVSCSPAPTTPRSVLSTVAATSARAIDKP
jgi:hypothetical protein